MAEAVLRFMQLEEQILIEKLIDAIMINIRKHADKKTLYLFLYWYPYPPREEALGLGVIKPMVIPKLTDKEPAWWLGGKRHVSCREIDEIEKMAEKHEFIPFECVFYDGLSDGWGSYEMPVNVSSKHVVKYIKHRLSQLLLTMPEAKTANWYMSSGVDRKDGSEEWLLLIKNEEECYG